MESMLEGGAGSSQETIFDRSGWENIGVLGTPSGDFGGVLEMLRWSTR